MTVPAWLAHRPSYLASLMTWRNVLRRSKAARWLGVVIAAACISPAVPAVVGCPVSAATARTLAGQPGVLFTATAVLFALFASHRRRRLARERTGYWLAALAIRESALERTAIAALAWLGALEWPLTALMVAARLPAQVERVPLLAVAAGALAGFWAGWFVPRANRAARLRSTRAGRSRIRPRWATRPALTPLGFWAVAGTRWGGRPRVSARWAALVLLAVPMGVAGSVALGIAGAVVVGLYFVVLTSSVVRVAFAAAWWLAPTCLGPLRLAVSTAYLASLEQAGIGVLALCGCDVLGGPRALAAGGDAVGLALLSSMLLEALAARLALREGRIVTSSWHRWLA